MSITRYYKAGTGWLVEKCRVNWHLMLFGISARLPSSTMRARTDVGLFNMLPVIQSNTVIDRCLKNRGENLSAHIYEIS